MIIESKTNLLPCQENSKQKPKKPFISGEKLQLDSTYQNNLLQMPYFAEKRDQYDPTWFFFQNTELQEKTQRLARLQLDMGKAIFEIGVKELLDRCRKRLNSKGLDHALAYILLRGRRWVRVSMARIGYESFGVSRRQEHRYFSVFKEEQDKLNKEYGFNLITIRSGKKTWDVNKYEICQMLYECPKLIEELISLLPENLLLKRRTPCHTIIKNIILRILNTYNKYINSNEDIDNQTPKCDKDIFFQRKKEKDVVSTLTCDKNTHHQSVRTQETIKGVACSDRTENHAKSLSILQKLGILDYMVEHREKQNAV